MGECMDALQYTGLVKFMATKFCKSLGVQGEDVDDAIQASWIAVLTALPNADPDRPLKPYLYACVRNALKQWAHERRLVRTCYRNRHRSQPQRADIEPAEVIPNRPDWTPDVLEMVRLAQELSPSDFDLFKRLLSGESGTDIAIRWRVSKQAVSQRRQRVITQLRQMME
jgi:RNA polymerase sigma factor (sigma-70 family)